MHPEHKFRVVAPDVGGGFAKKFILTLKMCYGLGQKDCKDQLSGCERTEFLSDCHGRDHITNCSVALRMMEQLQV